MIYYFILAIPTAAIIYGSHWIWGKLRIYYSHVKSSSTEHGGLIVADVLKAHGVKHIFTLCGGHISPVLIAAEKRGIRVVDVRHEVNAVFAADAVARVTGGIGVAAVTAGPGVTNTVTAVQNARLAESPVLLLGGAAATILKGRGALQDIDQMAILRPLCKMAVTINRIRDIAPVLREAIRTARSGTPGPVFVELPIDTLYPYALVRREMGLRDRPRGIRQRLLNAYLEFYMRNLFGGAFLPTECGPLPPIVPMPSTRKVSAAVNIIANANRPLILIGSQAMLPPVTSDKLASAVRSIGIPCYLGGMSRGLLGRQDMLQFRQCRREALAEADVIILAGAVCDFRLGYGRVLNRRAKVITINRSRENMLKNADMFWHASVTIQADVASSIIAMADLLKDRQMNEAVSDWLQLLRKREDEKEQENREKLFVPANVHLNPLRVLQTLEDIGLTDGAVLVADGGDFVGSAAYVLRPRGPLMWLDPGAFGTLGVGGGFALGVKLCRPETDVWIIYGDGSLGYSLMEFDTFARHGLGVVALVGNDACWSQIAREQVPMFGSNVGCQLEYTAYERAAEGLGGKGFILNRDNFADVETVFKQATETARRNVPVLINCLIGRSDFRQGSLSV